VQEQPEKKSHAREIRERREKIPFLIREKSETEIADTFGVSRETVVRDVAFLKKSVHLWLEDLTKHGFVFEYKLTLDRLNNYRTKLEKLYDKTEDVPQKISIIKELKEISKLYLELLSETPTIHAFRKAVKKANVQET